MKGEKNPERGVKRSETMCLQSVEGRFDGLPRAFWSMSPGVHGYCKPKSLWDTGEAKASVKGTLVVLMRRESQ